MSRFKQKKNEEKYTGAAQKQWFICIKTVFVTSLYEQNIACG